MNRQKIFDNAVSLLDGKGRCMKKSRWGDVCTYFRRGHPGSAVACQPGFEAKFKDVGMIGGIAFYFNFEPDPSVSRNLSAFFETPRGSKCHRDDVRFLSLLEAWHDDAGSWNGLRLHPERVRRFCRAHELIVPTKFTEIISVETTTDGSQLVAHGAMRWSWRTGFRPQGRRWVYLANGSTVGQRSRPRNCADQRSLHEGWLWRRGTRDYDCRRGSRDGESRADAGRVGANQNTHRIPNGEGD